MTVRAYHIALVNFFTNIVQRSVRVVRNVELLRCWIAMVKLHYVMWVLLTTIHAWLVLGCAYDINTLLPSILVVLPVRSPILWVRRHVRTLVLVPMNAAAGFSRQSYVSAIFTRFHGSPSKVVPRYCGVGTSALSKTVNGNYSIGPYPLSS